MTQTVLITGASSGFGKACANLFASSGWKLILVARRKERLQEFKQHFASTDKIHLLPLDIQDQKAVQERIHQLPKEFQTIDLLINNAGLALGLEPAQRANLEDWETMINTNIKGLVYLTHTILPMMVTQGHGQIINVGSIAGNWPYPGGNVYGATKAFVKQFTNNLRADLLGTSIKVTNIEPGLAESEFSIVRFHGDQEKAAKVYEGTNPLTPQDIAEIIYWVASTPKHLNINRIEVMPISQSWGALPVHRKLTKEESNDE